MADIPRTTIETTEEQREFLDNLKHGHIKPLISELLNCAIALGKKRGDRQAAAFIQAGMMELTRIRKEEGGE